MSNQLHHLVYYSRNNISRLETFEREVDSILEASRRNNSTAGITGALLFNAGCFAQVLEGPLAALEETFERIQQDERHGEVSLLALEPIDERSFPNWAMGFVGQAKDNSDVYARVGLSSGFNPALLGGKKIHAILKDLAIDEENIVA